MTAERRSPDTAATRASRRPRYRGRHERRLRPDARSRRHRHGGQRVVSVNTLFWKILVTRVKRKIVVVSHHRKEAPKKSPRRIIAQQDNPRSYASDRSRWPRTCRNEV